MSKLIVPLFLGVLFLGLSAGANEASAQRYGYGHGRSYRSHGYQRYVAPRYDCAPRYYAPRYDCAPRYYAPRYERRVHRSYEPPRYYRDYGYGSRDYGCDSRIGLSIRF